ncbi:MAG: hypothetical protein ACI8Y8_001236, partial [Planctomycetota bacterium]
MVNSFCQQGDVLTEELSDYPGGGLSGGFEYPEKNAHQRPS